MSHFDMPDSPQVARRKRLVLALIFVGLVCLLWVRP